MAGRRRGIDGQLVFLLALLGLLAALAWWRGGPELVREGLAGGAGILLRYGLVIVVALLAAGFAEALVPREWVGSALGERAGVRGILLGTAVGAMTPSGPFVAMPVAAVMLRSGAAAGPVVAYVAAWSLLALHRFVAWEVPILGLRFALLRYGACLLLPILAGLGVRALLRS